ncbi:uncharacterized protein LOC144100769 isoform X3 [Amblyomma americanum]
MYADLEDTFDVSSQRVATTPVHKASRRLRGLQPEFVQLTAPVRAMTSTAASQTSQHSGNALPFVLHAPRSPPPFHVDRFEDVEGWLASFDRVAGFNEWDGERKLRNVYFVLQDSAKTWFENHDALPHGRLFVKSC